MFLVFVWLAVLRVRNALLVFDAFKSAREQKQARLILSKECYLESVFGNCIDD